MLRCVQILFLSLAVLAILAISDRGAANAHVFTITNGCYTINNVSICPPEIRGYVPPLSPGPEDVLLIIDGSITTSQSNQQQEQHQQINQVEPGKEGKMPNNPAQQNNQVVPPGTVTHN